MNNKVWIAIKTAMWGLGSAAATGGADAAYQSLMTGKVSKEELVQVAVMGAVLGAISYYKNPPKEKVQ